MGARSGRRAGAGACCARRGDGTGRDGTERAELNGTDPLGFGPPARLRSSRPLARPPPPHTAPLPPPRLRSAVASLRSAVPQRPLAATRRLPRGALRARGAQRAVTGRQLGRAAFPNRSGP